MILFLHGMYSVDFPEQEFAIEKRVGDLATAQDFAVLAPRGEVGLCDWSPQVAHFACWPTRRTQLPQAGALLIRFGPAFLETSRRLENARITPWLLGFSNGGYFASFIATEAHLKLRGVAILHGGAIEPAQPISADRVMPTLLIAGEKDQFQRPKMEKLDALLTAAKWPHRFHLRPGGHALTDDDLHAALEIFRGHALDHQP